MLTQTLQDGPPRERIATSGVRGSAACALRRAQEGIGALRIRKTAMGLKLWTLRPATVGQNRPYGSEAECTR